MQLSFVKLRSCVLKALVSRQRPYVRFGFHLNLLLENVQGRTPSFCVHLFIFEKQKENSDWQAVVKSSNMSPTKPAYFDLLGTLTGVNIL
jgi:hypothetical protein